MSVEQIWRGLEESGQFGGSLRISEVHKSDFYCSIDIDGRRGLLLVTGRLHVTPPTFSAVEVSVGQRSDGRTVIALWLNQKALNAVFTLLCDDLVNATLPMETTEVGAIVISRLARWRRLLQPAAPAMLPISELRGLLGELTILKECIRVWNSRDAVVGWQGPLDAPQDFAIGGKALEVKAIVPAATSIRISSAEQLDVDDARILIVAVVELAASSRDAPLSFSIVTLITEIRAHIEAFPDLDGEFNRRLAAAGYVEHPDYEDLYFQCGSLRYFSVKGEFPRVTRMELRSGVLEVTYDVALAACMPFSTALEA